MRPVKLQYDVNMFFCSLFKLSYDPELSRPKKVMHSQMSLECCSSKHLPETARMSVGEQI